MKRCFASLTLAAFAFTGSVISAPITSVPYNVVHNFNTRLIGNQVYRGAWQWFDHSLANSTVAAPDDDVVTGNAAFTPPSTDTMTATSTSGTATADANSQYNANADGTGFARVFGGGTLGANGTRVASEASTTVALNRGVTNRAGGISWSPNWSYITAATGRLGDPIDVSYQNLDDFTTITSQLFDLNITFGQGGSSSYSNGDVTVSGTDGRFYLFMDSPYITSGRGTIELIFAGGLITQSTGTGIYNGILPSVGSDSTAIAFHLGDANGTFDIDFDFGSVPGNVNGYDFQAVLGTSAFVEAYGVPEPATWLLIASGCAYAFAARRYARGRPP